LKQLVVIVVDDRLGGISVRVLLLDHRRPVDRLVFLYDGGAIPVDITVMIAAFANSHTGAHRTNSDTNVIR
jgi:hypothetical protein